MAEFDFSHLCGWDADVAKDGLANLSPKFKRPFELKGGGPTSRRMALFNPVRKVLGKDIENIPQEIGDCVSWGGKHAVEYLQCYQIAMGNFAEFRLIFSPYHYGTGRVYVGHSWGMQDGSCGSWQVEAIEKYGVICLTDPGVPPYSGSVARQYGRNAGNVLDKFSSLGKQHIIKGGAQVTTKDQLVASITNGYPVTVASNQGFTMLPQSDGFHHPHGSWAHQMCIVYVDDDGGNVESHVGILNSWGDVHGTIVDFRDPSLKWPVGMLRVRMDVAVSMLEANDSFAYSAFEDFPAQVLPIDQFHQW